LIRIIGKSDAVGLAEPHVEAQASL
jgi:hypothetical protein